MAEAVKSFRPSGPRREALKSGKDPMRIFLMPLHDLTRLDAVVKSYNIPLYVKKAYFKAVKLCKYSQFLRN